MDEDDPGKVSGTVMKLWYLVCGICWDVWKEMVTSLRFVGIVLLGESLLVKYGGSVIVDNKEFRIRSRRATYSLN